MTSNTTKRVAGAAKELGGKIQKNVGKALGDHEMEAKGAVKEVVGGAEQTTAKTAEAAKGVGEQVSGKAKELVGKAREAFNR